MSVMTDMAQEEIKMEMTPMIDVTFLLLIFFLLTLKFKVLEGKLSAYLPKDVGVNSSQADPIEKVEVYITVLKAGSKVFPPADKERRGQPFVADPDKPEARFEYKGRVLEYGLGPKKTKDLKKLFTWVKEARDRDEEAPSTIHTFPGCSYGDVVPVLDNLVDAGFDKITFAGEEKARKKK